MFLGKVGSGLQKPNGLVVITYGIGRRMAAAEPRQYHDRCSAMECDPVPAVARLGRRVLVHQMLA
jgi:hypothetical protein